MGCKRKTSNVLARKNRTSFFCFLWLHFLPTSCIHTDWILVHLGKMLTLFFCFFSFLPHFFLCGHFYLVCFLWCPRVKNSHLGIYSIILLIGYTYPWLAAPPPSLKNYKNICKCVGCWPTKSPFCRKKKEPMQSDGGGPLFMYLLCMRLTILMSAQKE